MRRILIRLLNLFRHAHAEDELAREMAAHLALIEEDYRHRGLSPEEARLAARRAMNGVELAKDRHRDARAFRWLDETSQDFRAAGRLLRRDPGFAAAAIVSIALGVGVNASIFSVADGMLFRPLPYPGADRLVVLQPYARTGRVGSMSVATFETIKAAATSFDALDHTDFAGLADTLLVGDEPVRLYAYAVGPDLLRVLAVPPSQGRTFTAADFNGSAERPAIVLPALWRRLGSPADLAGKTLTLEQRTLRIVGVMPPGFVFPVGPSGNPQPDMLIPDVPDPTRPGLAGSRVAPPIARLVPGVSLARARAEVEAVTAADDSGVTVVSLREGLFQTGRPVLAALLGAAGFVLLIVCANVAGLLLARGVARERELAVRRALGGSRGRLMRQLGVESAILACLGGAGGLLLAFATFDVVYRLVPGRIYRVLPAGVDHRVVAFAVGLSVAMAVLVGTLPAIRLSQPRLSDVLRHGQGRAPGSRGWWSGRTLITTEVAVAVLLLSSAGLMVKTLVALSSVDLGLDPEHLTSVRVSLPASRYPRPEAFRYYFELIDRLAVQPGIDAAAGVGGIPLLTTGDTQLTLPAGDAAEQGQVWHVTADYFRTFGIRMIAGRPFTREESLRDAPVAVISESAARIGWGGAGALGQTIENPGDQPRQIIGIVADVRRALTRSSIPLMYEPFNPAGFRSTMTVGVRSTLGPDALRAMIRAAARAGDPRLLVDVSPYRAVLETLEVTLPRFQAVLFSAFAGLGLLLTAVGIYGTLAFVVARRTHEIGIRLALGAGVGDVRRLVIRHGLLPTAAGLAIGLGAAYAVSRAMERWLFEVRPHDPATTAAATAVLLFVALVAMWTPARRASRVDPMVALRCE